MIISANRYREILMGRVKMKTNIWRLLLISVLLAVLAGKGAAQDDLGYSFMQPGPWLKSTSDLANLPKARIDQEIRYMLNQAESHHYGTSMDLLSNIDYDPNQRNQGGCGNCWVWAGTGIMEIAHKVQYGVPERFSVQYFNSCFPDNACCGGSLERFVNWYDEQNIAIPWDNGNGSFADGSRSCGITSAVQCESISTVPNSPISSIQEVVIDTFGQDQATAVQNMKNILNQQKGIFYGIAFPNSNALSAFVNFWNGVGAPPGNDVEATVWNPDTYCGQEWNEGPGQTGGGHGVVILGYNDDSPEVLNHYWIALNSWGTADGKRPNGLFRIRMYSNYNCVYPDTTVDSDPDIDQYWIGNYYATMNVRFSNVFPSEGTIGTVFTVTGSGFGTRKPKVYLEYEKKPGIYGKAYARVTGWSDSSLTCLWTAKLPPGTYPLFVQPAIRGAGRIPVDTFTIQNPVIDAIGPNSCSIGEINTVSGQFFSSKKPKVYLENASTFKKYSCKVSSFTMNPETGESSLQFAVPKIGDLDVVDYTLILKNTIGQTTADFCGPKNLTPFKPATWSDKIVVSRVTGSNTDDSPLYTTDTLSVDWAVMNDGTAAVSGAFYTDLYLDGVRIASWSSDPPLNPGYYTYVTDYSLGSLSAGTHTLSIVADSTHAVNENNESDNGYTKTINVINPPPPPAQGWTLTVINNYAYPISELYISPSSSSTWGNNWLSAPIPSGGSRSISNIAPGTYDLRAVATNGAEAVSYDFVMAAGQTLEWTLQ
jgi:hypothetical protein